jgi:signal transduction histidine kinase/DNA-binding response OmpR family regulator
MPDKTLKIVLVDDEPAHHVLLASYLRKAFPGISLSHASSLAEARQILEQDHPDMALIDLNLPDGRGDVLLSEGQFRKSFPMVIMTSHGDEEVAVEAMKNGASDYVVKSPAAFADVSHLVSRTLTNWSNIRARLDAEAELRESEAKYRRLSQEFQTMLEGIPDAISLLDRDMKLIWANRVAIESTASKGYLGTSYCFNLWQDRDTPCENCPVHRSFTTGKPAEEVVEHPDGRLWSERSFPIRNHDGSVANVVLVAADITERTKLRAEAMRSSQLAALGELAAGVGHEINNPLNAVINYAQLLIDGGLEGEMRGYAELILREGQRMADITSNLLTFSRKPLEESQSMSMSAALDGVMKLTAVKLRHDNIKLILKCDEDLPRVVGNFQQIQQVLLNIINNAGYALNERFPATDANKKLFIFLRAGTYDDRRWLRTTVIDFGTGMNKESLNKVFEPFYTNKPQGCGTGLGMNISEGIIRDHGGRISYRSRFGFWTRVVIDLPAASRDA